MSYNHGKHTVQLLLKQGESRASQPIRCTNCGRMLCKINKEVLYILIDNPGIHWADVPDDQSRLEHKCRGCDWYYIIYTPLGVKIEAMVDDYHRV